MKQRVALAAALTALLSFAALQAPRAQFNGCTAGFCSPVSGIVSSATNSLIFTAASSQSLSQTGKTSINQQKFTVPLWFKRASTGTNQLFFYFGDGTTNNRIALSLTSANVLNLAGVVGGSNILSLITTSTYTDTLNWHHLLIAVDTTQATASNRALIYIDGTVVSAFTTATYPAQNTNLANNFAASYKLGANQTPASFFDGKMAQSYYIDGQQLTPTSFITGTPGVPKTYSGTYTGTFDFFLPFSNGTSTTTLGADGSGESNNWTLNNMTTANQSTDHP